MTSNSQPIIQDIGQEFETLLDFVAGEQAQQATADYIERGLFKLMLVMGAKLLRLFFRHAGLKLVLVQPTRPQLG